MYRTCECEDFPCCGHGLCEALEFDPWDDPNFDPYLYEDLED